MNLLLVVAGAAIGAPLRYLTDLFIQSRHDSVVPWGTMTVNAVGCLVLGGTAAVVASTSGSAWLTTLVGAGFCGALTTFSTFGFETVRLIEDGSTLEALGNVALSLVIGLVAVFGGWSIAAAVV